jgi:ubiquinone/menaquinone biosynthesis C-methylase UbiE
MSALRLPDLPLRAGAALHDLGHWSPQWAGIHSPGVDEAEVRRYVQAQFLDEAERYARNYRWDAIWSRNVDIALEGRDVDAQGEWLILDVGSGAGNSVFALLARFARARVVASDLSLPLLRILRRVLHEEQPHDAARVATVQQNAEDLSFAEGSFDLVCGGSILHHLLEPAACLRECARVLKPGGFALFFEPFETGNQIVGLWLRQCLESHTLRPDHERLDAATVRFFEALLLDYRTRKDLQPGHHLLPHLDDKWMFTRGWFEQQATACGFRSVALRSLHPVEQRFCTHLDVLLRIGLGQGFDAQPPWVRATAEALDAQFSPAARAELLIEAAVVLEK